MQCAKSAYSVCVSRLRTSGDVGDRKGRVDAAVLKTGKKAHQGGRPPAPPDSRSLAAGRLRRPSAGPLDTSAGAPLLTHPNENESARLHVGDQSRRCPTFISASLN